MEDEEQRFCRLGECGKLLVQKPGETKQNWLNRKTCNKNCAARRPRSKKARAAVGRVMGGFLRRMEGKG